MKSKSNQVSACELCKAPSTFFSKKNNYEYYKCSNCSFLFIYPSIDLNTLSKLYENENYSSTKLERKHRLLFKKIIQINKSKPSVRKILDIGCQNGDFLNLLDETKKFELFGVEASEQSVKRASKNKSLHITSGMFSSDLFESNKFDFVHLGDVIEHVESPEKMLQDIKKVVNNFGMLAISTPITNCPYVILNNLIFSYFPKYALAYLTPPYHLKYFSSKTLDKLMLRLGFTKIDYFFTSSNFRYELIESQIFKGFSESRLKKILKIQFILNLSIFSFSYFLIKILGIFYKNKFSYTAIYKKLS